MVVPVERKLEAPPARNWSELPMDALSSVSGMLDAVEVLMGAGLVCRHWLRAAQLPELWRSVDMASLKQMVTMDSGTLCAMAKVAVDRSAGELEAFLGKRFVDDDLLKYIYRDRALSLKRLCIISCKDVCNQGFAEAIKKFPLLEELQFSLCRNIYERYAFETAGKSCPKLTRFWRSENTIHEHENSTSFKDKEAMGTAAMTGLRSLHLLGNSLTNGGLAAILDSCPHLETLDIRHCFNVKMDQTLRAKCASLKTLRLPEDSIDDYEFKHQIPLWFWWLQTYSDNTSDTTTTIMTMPISLGRSTVLIMIYYSINPSFRTG